jgi:hypothetical protein
MRIRRHRLSAPAIATAVIASVIGLAAPASAVPVVGACYDYNAKTLKAVSSNAPAIGCDAPHTAETYYVRTIPDSFGLPSKSSLGAQLSASKPCTVTAINAYLGMPGRALPSRFRSVPLFPTDAQWTAGERWMRCDVALQEGLGLQPFAGTVTAFVASQPQDTFNFCTRGAPNPLKVAAYVCQAPKKPHWADNPPRDLNWLKVFEVRVGTAGSKFPGDASVLKQSSALCQKMGKKWKGTQALPGWWRIYPTASGWKKGLRSIQCFVPYAQYLEHLAARAPKPVPAPGPTATPTPVAPVASPSPQP